MVCNLDDTIFCLFDTNISFKDHELIQFKSFEMDQPKT